MPKNDPLPQLDAEEQDLLDAFERGEGETVQNWQSNLMIYQEAARAKLESMGLVNLQLSSEDFAILKKRAADAGLPYQIFISNILHRYLSGDLVTQ